jgi:GrpB-like predicted nucleotidyltransferase (UPF0157 family)
MSGRPIGEQEQAPAACLPYDPRAQEVARKVAGMSKHQLPDITVDHVGSTAVPGCAGKGVIDLLIPYRKGGLEPVKETLRELGFQRQGTPGTPSPKTCRCAWAPLDSTEIHSGSTSTWYPQTPANPTRFGPSATASAPTLR